MGRTAVSAPRASACVSSPVELEEALLDTEREQAGARIMTA